MYVSTSDRPRIHFQQLRNLNVIFDPLLNLILGSFVIVISITDATVKPPSNSKRIMFSPLLFSPLPSLPPSPLPIPSLLVWFCFC